MTRAWPMVVIALLAPAAPARAQQPAPQPDPLAAHLFPPDLVMRHATEIGLDDRQRPAVKDAVIKLQASVLDLQWDLQAESEKMARLLQASPIEEAAVLAQADKIMGLEREVKRAHLSMLIRIKNLLTDTQRDKLAELRRRAEAGR